MSNAIHNPALSKIEEIDSNSATFTIEPLHPRYGNTLGNSLRRVLLSSIEGGAIVAFRIEGTNHEFSTVAGVKEDVVDIMLNLKKVRLRIYSSEPVELRLEKKGSGPVLAGDIKTTSDVEIVNPDHVIANIDDPKTTVAMDLVAEAGRGYRSIEDSSKQRLHSDMIALDAIFTPVKRARFKVDTTRVGEETNLDKLSLTIETDGSIDPKDAFEQAAAILVNQFQALAGSTVVEAAPSLGSQDEEDDGILTTSIEELNLSARTANALVNSDIRTVQDLVSLSEQDLRELKGFGSKALDEVKDKLTELEI